MYEILIVVDEQAGTVLVETDDGEQQFTSADEAMAYVQTLLPGAGAEPAVDTAADPAASELDSQAMWDEEAAARVPMH